MNPLKKGPQIKMPRLKAPEWISDVYRDLRDRHLLPLVALLVVAIVAVPILLSESGGREEASQPSGSAAANPSNTSELRNIVVTRSTPKLRSYHQRLEHRSASNPFKQQYTHSAATEGSGGGGTTEEGGGTTEAGEVPVEEEHTVTEHHEFKYFTYTIDVKIAPVSSKGVPSTAKPTVRRNLPELSQLPSRQVPALIFMQPAADGKKALMLLNENVRSVFGEAACVAGDETCQMLALKPGMPETIVYGGSERTYRITLLGVHLEETDHLKKAPITKPHTSNRQGTSDLEPGLTSSAVVRQPR